MERVKPHYLDVNSKGLVDDFVVTKRWEEIRPQTSELDIDGELILTTSNKSDYFLIEESKFIFDIDVTKVDGTRYADTDRISLVNNAIMYMFNKAKLRFDSTDIETIDHLGPTTSCLGHLNYGSSYTEYNGLKQGWFYEDTAQGITTCSGYKKMHRLLIDDNSVKGKITVTVPFNHIYGFKGKILLGINTSVIFERKLSDLPVIRVNVVDAAKISLKRLVWKAEYIKLAEFAQIEMQRNILDEKHINYPFQHRECHRIHVPPGDTFTWDLTHIDTRSRAYGIILFFVTGTRNSQEKNPNMLNHLDLIDARVRMNTEVYPNLDLRCDFGDNTYMECYDRFDDFKQKLSFTDTHILPYEFKNMYPYFVFDVSNQVERIAGTSDQIRIECKFKTTVPADTDAYAVLLTDRMLTLQFLKDKSMKFVAY